MAGKFHITTYGCQMNKHDSERVAGLLSSLGFTATADEAEADIIIVNSCSVRQSAEERIYGSQEKYLEYKKRRPEMLVAVTGCLPGRDKKGEYRSRLPGTDLYFAIADLPKLPAEIARLRPDWKSDLPLRRGDEEGLAPCSDYLRIPPLRVPSSQAYVTIQTGCNKFCSYCVVPYARGLERNRPFKEIMDECRSLVSQGILEITLLGQSVNSHPDFATLLHELNKLDGLRRLHWTAAHPLSMSDEVIQALALPKQVNYLHLPVQSGNDEVLRRMNRKYTRAQFLDIIRRVKAARPGIALGTDIIVGFSGETKEQFEDTLSLYREVDFDIAYPAQYSVRSGTLAAKIYPDDVPEEEKQARWRAVQTLMEETTARKNLAFKNRVVSVLVDHVENGLASGQSNEMKLVRFPSGDASLVGQITDVFITDPKAWILDGRAIV